MRLYTFVHTMLKPTHQGVQGIHSLARLWLRYDKSDWKESLTDCARNHETVIMKDGGNSANMRRIALVLESCPLPFATFEEDVDTLDGVTTSITLFVPTHLWLLTDYIRNNPECPLVASNQPVQIQYYGNVVSVPTELQVWEQNIIRLLNSCKLA